ncbi:EAL domain-containing protein [uncultured Ferrimonas sp.]|uniref:bifunctional diguanylate cyclase/phosphodiesterase n=1 Tax=uncultured Ferrimonas sp. TaxID=432640 RepID=UPI0026210778|nr:EAL domain-containing protein [uncultured Ferrimonas sp.]
MTLYKQLSTFIFSIFVLVAVGLSWGQLNEARGFLYQQMQSELNNSSQALTLMLQPSMEQADKVAAEALITAMFEGGLYQSIRLKWLADDSEQTWYNNHVDVAVPSWFRQLPLFETPSRNTTIISGWLQLGELEIVAHPGYGYRQIWHSFITSLIIISLMLVLMLTLAKWGLRRLLAPLQQVQQRAEQVAKKQFSAPMVEPKTAELAQLVRSINSMESQLQQQFAAHKEQVSSLQQSLLTDAVSKLPNRQYIVSRLSSWLQEPSDGAIALVQIPLLEQVRQQFGYQLRDELIGRLGTELAELGSGFNTTASRISAHEFLLLAQDLEPTQQHQLTQQLQQLLRRFEQSCGLAEPQPCAIGAVSRQQEHDSQQLLAQADQAMRQAQLQDKPLCWFAQLQQQPTSVEQWRTLLDDGLQQRLVLYRQPVLDWHSQTPHHYELFGRIQYQGQEFHAGQFLPYLNMIDRGEAFDRALIEQVINTKALRQSEQPLAINLTAAAVNTPSFQLWLIELLSQQRYPLQFEVSEQLAVGGSAALTQLRRQLGQLGYGFGIDHFGRELASLDYLQQLSPDYVRLDHAFVANDNEQNRQLSRALCLTAQGLQIQVYLAGVQMQEQLAPWQALHLSGYQGFIQPPKRLEAALIAAELSHQGVADSEHNGR